MSEEVSMVEVERQMHLGNLANGPDMCTPSEITAAIYFLLDNMKLAKGEA